MQKNLKKWKTGRTRKYNNHPTKIDGWKFDSKSEAKRYLELKLLKESGEVIGFDVHPSFALTPTVRYVGDFLVYYEDGRIEVEDVKAIETQAFKIKKRLFNESHPLAPLTIIDVRRRR